MAENFSNFLGGFSVFLIGVVMVFFALVLLILLIKLVGMIVSKIENKPKHATEVNVKAVEAIQKAQEEVAVVKGPSVNELELVAVITAAIAASLGTTTDKLMVRSLRKVNR